MFQFVLILNKFGKRTYTNLQAGYISKTTMRKINMLIVLTSLLLFSCDGYQQSPVSVDYLSSLNDTVSNGQKNGATWPNAPEEIARHLFPPVSLDSGSTLYEVNKKTNSSTDCKVTVTEEGPIDDEVLGERHILYFRNMNGIWKIIDLKKQIKRRP